MFLVILGCSTDDELKVLEIDKNTEPIETPNTTNPDIIFPEGSLNSYFSNVLISDNFDNINRQSAIKIIAYDVLKIV